MPQCKQKRDFCKARDCTFRALLANGAGTDRCCMKDTVAYTWNWCSSQCLQMRFSASLMPCIVSTSNIFAVLATFQQAPRPQATAAPSRSSVESIPNATQFTNDIIADEKK